MPEKKLVGKLDLNAPRFRLTKGAFSVISRERYIAYKRKYPKSTLTYKEYSNFLLDHINLVRETIITTRDGVKFPNSIGAMFLGGYRPSNASQNYNATTRYGLNIKDLNFQTDGLLAKIYFTNYSKRFKIETRKIWYFLGARKLTRGASAEFRNNHTLYKTIVMKDRVWKTITE
jgi:hypothetical protein